MRNVILHGDNIELLKQFPDNHFDSIVTDAPYGFSKEPNASEVLARWIHDDLFEPIGAGFMGHAWDAFVPSPNFWKECLRVLKPGGYVTSFFGTRTYDWGVMAMRLAGFEIRDQIAWIYSCGFPKSKNLNGDHEGKGTALKPAIEPIVLARKPLQGTVAQNVEKWGTGALNIAACSIPFAGAADAAESKNKNQHASYGTPSGTNAVFGDYSMVPRKNYNPPGRWPSNVLHDGSDDIDNEFNEFRDAGVSPLRFFYCAKATKEEKEIGLEHFALREAGVKNVSGRGYSEAKPYAKVQRRNIHPTVKPIALMRYLVRLVTPPGGITLDPFAGSGSTCIAARLEGCDFIGMEMEAEYHAAAQARADAWERYANIDNPAYVPPSSNQLPLFKDLTTKTNQR